MSKRIYVQDGSSELSNFKVGQKFSRSYKVIDKGEDHLIVARTFKNGNIKELTKKIVKIDNHSK